METVQLVKDFTVKHAKGVVTFYLNLNEECTHVELIDLLNVFWVWGDIQLLTYQFYSRAQWPKESDDQFVNELQLLNWKVLNV